MNTFDLQQWLEQQHEYNLQLKTAKSNEANEVETAGFGFPYYADVDSPSTNHYLHL